MGRISVHIYKGENRLLIVPFVGCTAALWHVKLDENATYEDIGKACLEAIQYVKETDDIDDYPDSEAVWITNTRYKSWVSFWKNNYFAHIQINDDSIPYIYTSQRSELDPGCFTKTLKKEFFELDIAPEKLGCIVDELFKASEEYHKNHKPSDKWRRTQLELIDGTEMLVLRPKDSHFEDYYDYNSGDIYQWYSYIANDNNPCAHFYVGMANELNCNLEPQNVKNIWEYQGEKAESFTMEECSFGIFKLKAQMKNSKEHRISYYLKRSDDEILECAMIFELPDKRKKLDEKLTVMFDEFVASCSFYV